MPHSRLGIHDGRKALVVEGLNLEQAVTFAVRWKWVPELLTPDVGRNPVSYRKFKKSPWKLTGRVESGSADPCLTTGLR